MSAPEVGIGKDNTPTLNRQNLIKALSRSSGGIVFPPATTSWTTPLLTSLSRASGVS